MYLREVKSLFEFGSWHEEGIQHGHSLRKHGDLQLMFILTKEQIRVWLTVHQKPRGSKVQRQVDLNIL